MQPRLFLPPLLVVVSMEMYHIFTFSQHDVAAGKLLTKSFCHFLTIRIMRVAVWGCGPS